MRLEGDRNSLEGKVVNMMWKLKHLYSCLRKESPGKDQGNTLELNESSHAYLLKSI